MGPWWRPTGSHRDLLLFRQPRRLLRQTSGWLGGLDSNQRFLVQSQASCRWTTPEWRCSRVLPPYFLLDRQACRPATPEHHAPRAPGRPRDGPQAHDTLLGYPPAPAISLAGRGGLAPPSAVLETASLAADLPAWVRHLDKKKRPRGSVPRGLGEASRVKRISVLAKARKYPDFPAPRNEGRSPVAVGSTRMRCGGPSAGGVLCGRHIGGRAQRSARSYRWFPGCF